MLCVYCANPLPDGARFCNNCGKVLQVDQPGDQTEMVHWDEWKGQDQAAAPPMQGGPNQPPIMQGGPTLNQPPMVLGGFQTAQGFVTEPDRIFTPPQGPGGGMQMPPGLMPPPRKRSGGNSTMLKLALLILAALVILGGGGALAFAALRNAGNNKPPTTQNNPNNGSKNDKTATPTTGITPAVTPTIRATATSNTTSFPANTATFQLKVTLTLKADDNQKSNPSLWGRTDSEEITLVVTGGKVCQVRDDGRTVSEAFTLPTGQLGDKWVYSRKFACNGTYKDGKLSYTETVVSETLSGQGNFSATSTADLANKTCPAKEYVYDQLDGTFTSATAIAGSFSWSGASAGHCAGQAPVKGTGTWTSQLA